MFSSLSVLSKSREGKEVVGFLNSLPSSLLCEMAGKAGYDFVILDMEHLLREERDVLDCIRSCELAGVEPWVRVPGVDPKRIGRLLDNGARAIVLPKVESREEVRKAVEAAWFPPQGQRTITGGRITGFGTLPIAEYVKQVNKSAFIVPMIESKKGAALFSDILSQNGILAAMDGALDLAVDIGVGADPTDEAVQDVVKSIALYCIKKNIPFCANPRTPQQKELLEKLGIKCFLAGEDRGIILSALKERRAQFTLLP
ncbi:HpcH/HpaI aldolase family protein [Entomobacter blattae]|uniref:2-dehydro-3,6-dideoxy-6-sulfogluconate aldolase n=1 Tax=Entomobacter blattae TaxID=2762277 RepID=A0A7H1NTX6_9PROT|nr:aldolase/citrate lyase family protein [Entomobacter blattae]QNT79236.1 2-dehydro-3,6-dideoxy-6-sulfogluconate aldolase [Entomobacter blattae]